MKEARKVCPPPNLQGVTALCLVRERQDVPKMENGLLPCVHTPIALSRGQFFLPPGPSSWEGVSRWLNVISTLR